MDKKIRVGVIGCGQISHMNHFPKYEAAGAEIVAACDIREDRLDAACEKYHIPNKYTKFRDLLARDDIDAVSVCLHNNLHAPAAIAALRAGKHVYCEKPIAGSYADGKLMVDTANECGKMLHIQLGLIYNPNARAAKNLIDGGKLGKIYHMRSIGYRRRGRPWVDGYGAIEFAQKSVAAGGALFDMGVYHISQLLYLTNMPKVQKVSGKIYRELNNADPERVRSSGFDVEELGLGLVRFEGGLTMDVLESWAVHMNPFEESCIFGTDGGIRIEPFGFYTTMCDLELNALVNTAGYDSRMHEMHAEEMKLRDGSMNHWLAALAGKTELYPTKDIALQTMLIQEGIYMSSERDGEITAEEVTAASKSKALNI
ncbi:MAG: Gfo/Idh/MocA family oxidoreductase [Firmicutes bacterium]|nr:Gfo/Idh/MocA family oxidoreductase [Bacillota bacterium]